MTHKEGFASPCATSACVHSYFADGPVFALKWWVCDGRIGDTPNASCPEHGDGNCRFRETVYFKYEPRVMGWQRTRKATTSVPVRQQDVGQGTYGRGCVRNFVGVVLHSNTHGLFAQKGLVGGASCGTGLIAAVTSLPCSLRFSPLSLSGVLHEVVELRSATRKRFYPTTQICAKCTTLMLVV